MEAEITCGHSQPTKVSFNQLRYRPLGSKIIDDTQWTVPMCVHYSDGKLEHRECALISPKNNILQLKSSSCPAWFMPNSDGNGYYRWKLNEQYWQALLNEFDGLNNGEQLAIIDSVFSGFNAGKVDINTMLSAVKISTKSNIRQVVEMQMGDLGYYITKVFDKELSEKIVNEITPWYLTKLTQLEASNTHSALSNNQLLLKNRLVSFIASILKHKKTRAKLIIQAQTFIDSKGKMKLINF